MGVGKTTVGLALANQLGWPLSDSDAAITERHGATVRELQLRLGTDGMHRLESEHLLDALASETPSVICAAASTIDAPECRRALRSRDIFVVWLRGSAHLLAGRFAGGPHRPVLATDTEALFRAQQASRSRRFAEVADLQVDIEGRPAEEIVAVIRRALDRGAI